MSCVLCSCSLLFVSFYVGKTNKGAAEVPAPPAAALPILPGATKG